MALFHHRAVASAFVGLLALAGCSSTNDEPGAAPTVGGADQTSAPETTDTGSPQTSQAGTPPPEDDVAVERRMERMVFDLVNAERTERALEPLEWDDQLAGLARDWTAQMAEEGTLEHQDTQVVLKRSEGFTGVGENIFRGAGPVPASTVHVGWMRSAGHRANVLRPGFDRIGIGFVCDDGVLWATQRFGRTAGTGSLGSDDTAPPQEPIVAREGQGPTCPGATGRPDVVPG
ncbi:CAP domain-containing protein [Rhabdothermincola salaria]|uniref:CAP domain-containing protein n=1 Tax=Rhabdothermincola salaria TaxID=2903142 RepID=UPI001E37E26B|nr:CAP domain-containing protein [Rhabdothermincola salaria]MCD9625637.1 CAP domain-containing protein [Rhabdothermincola salaria]